MQLRYEEQLRNEKIRQLPKKKLLVGEKMCSENIEKNIWKVNRKFHPMMIGFCFDKKEIRQILKKLKYNFKRLSEYQIYDDVFQFISSNNKFSRRVQYDLDLKYREVVEEIRSIEESQIKSWWRKRLAAGETGCTLWAVLIHTDLPQKDLDQFYDEFHLTISFNLSSFKKVQVEKDKLEKLFRSTSGELKETRSQTRSLQKTIKSQEIQIAAQTRKIDILQTKDRDLPNIEVSNKFQAKIRENSEEISKLKYQLQTRKEALDNLKVKYRKLYQAAFHNKDKPIEPSFFCVPEATFENEKCKDCPEYDLCHQKVLIVGGIEKMRVNYRKIVEDLGGKFGYHGGHNSGCYGNLENMITWADVILCPVNVNSHYACLNVKRICKKENKSFYMLPSSGISTISQTLRKVAINIS